MKAFDILKDLETRSVSMENYQIHNIEEPLSDCCRLFGDFNACVLASPGCYLCECISIDETPSIPSTDALLILENPNLAGVVVMCRID